MTEYTVFSCTAHTSLSIQVTQQTKSYANSIKTSFVFNIKSSFNSLLSMFYFLLFFS